jgi:transposase
VILAAVSGSAWASTVAIALSASFVGLVPSEASTGQRRRLGSITKTGSRRARRLLVEAAWHYRPTVFARRPSG